jgi:hypothetical protein
MLLRRCASQSLQTAAAWRFCGTEMLAAPRPAERVQLEREDGAILRPKARHVRDETPLTGVWFAQNVKIVPNSLRHECA